MFIAMFAVPIFQFNTADIEIHNKTEKHKRGTAAASTSKQLTAFFKSTTTPSMIDLETAAREGVWAYHLINENENFRSADSRVKIILLRLNFWLNFLLNF